MDRYAPGFNPGKDKPFENKRLSMGAEVKAHAHVGDQGLAEPVVPVVRHYCRKDSRWDGFDSFASGSGYSQKSGLSGLELAGYDGEPRTGLVC